MMKIDAVAKFEVERKFVLPPCLHLPIAAKHKLSISDYIGEIECELSRQGTNNAFLVSVPKSSRINRRLPIWEGMLV